MGLSLPRLLRAEGQPNGTGLTPRADACIILFLDGGPSHLDMWDMKPDAPAEIRGEFRPINSSFPGVPVCEHLPRLARFMHHATLIRSVHHSVNNAHAAAVYVGLTGHDRGDATVAIGTGPNDYPAMGSVVSLCRPPRAVVPPYVSMPYITAEGAGGPPQPGFFGGWLGRNADPMFILNDPSAPNFGMPELGLPEGVGPARFSDRKRLLAGVGNVAEALCATAGSRRWTASRPVRSNCSPPRRPGARSNSTARIPACAIPMAATSTAKARSWRAGSSRPALGSPASRGHPTPTPPGIPTATTSINSRTSSSRSSTRPWAH